MTLLDRITQIFKRQIVATTVPDTAQEMPEPPSQPTEIGQRLKSERERRRIVDICNEMYDTDPRAEGAINALARDIVKGGFSVTCRSNPRAGEVAAAFNERMKIQSILDDWLRETFIEGDTLLEVGAGEGLSGEDEILSLTRKPTLAMNRNTDHTDQFSDPLRAFYYADGLSLYADVPPDAIWFAQWQIVHARWAHRSKRKYGRPLFASAISSWKRITEGELDIAVRRKTRAGMKYLHVVEGADEGELTKYKERNKAVLDNPFAAVADLFSNKAGSVTTIQGDARLGEIDDVMHHIETWWTASPVPMVLVGYGKDLNRDVLEQKLTQYERALEQMTQWAEDEFVKPLLEREWLLKGIYPPGLKYDIVWKYKAPTSAADLRNVADAIVRFKALGMSDELIWPIVSRFLPWLDLTNLLASGATTGQVDQQPARLGTAIT